MKTNRSVIPTILLIGALWGVFEATVGYALHLLPWKIGSYIWFPAAFFFMDRVYRATSKRWAVVATAALSAAIKLLNLTSPIRVDYVLNPAASIVWESFAMVCVLSITALKDKRTFGAVAVKIFAVNTLWRFIYALYLSVLVPEWMREVSVVRDAEAFLPFILSQNLISTAVCTVITFAYGAIEQKLPRPRFASERARYAFAAVLVGCSIFAQIVL